MRRSDRRQAYDELLGVIRGVRRRWRIRVLLRGLAVSVGVAVAATLAAGALLGAVDPGAGVVAGVRAIAAGVVLLTAAVFLVRPLVRRVPDETVALYLEEHEPSLEAAVLSALEARSDDAAAPAPVSDALLRRTLEGAIRRCHAIDDGRWVERNALLRVGAALAAVTVVGALVGFFGPASARRGAVLLFSSPRAAEAAAPRAVAVEPGDATVSRGADVAIAARLHGFDDGLVELAVRAPGDSAFDRLPMAAAADGRFGYLLFDLDEDTEYYVEAGGVRSPVFTLTVAELPYADRIDLELVYPSYTGLPPERVADGGDITALRGTTVRVRVTPTLSVGAGGIVVDGAAPLPLAPEAGEEAAAAEEAEAPEDGTGPAPAVLVGEFTVRADGFYHIVLDGPDGAPVEASPRYVIDALSDGEPIVVFEEPGRDERATPIDELFVEARAEDDYGVAALTLHYAVNGGAERTVALYGGRGGLREVTAGHTFYLEELSLEPGDLVAYWATARDNDGVAGGKPVTSDLYFIQIRPFSREFRAADQRPPPGQGGQGGGGENGDLAGRQRQIVAGTFNLVRDSAGMTTEALRENLNTLALAQERLRDDARALAGRMVARRVTQDSAFRLIAELLPRAADEMEGAATRLRSRAPGSALPPEQRALRLLQRAEAVFREVQVTLGQGQGGGQAGGSPNAEDLADLFELEMDKLRDQYETVNRGGGADSTRAALDETAQRLEELARRQQREAERRRAEALRGRGTAGGDAQRQLAEEVEEEARRLERLSREQRSPALDEAARRLRDVATSMRRSAAGAGDPERAAERLRDARRLLERTDTESLRRRAADAADRAAELAREQERIRRESERLRGSPRGAEADRRAGELEERKASQQEDVASLERELRRLAGEAGTEQPEAARRLRDAAGTITESRVEEKIDFSRQLARGGAPDEYVRRLEEQIQDDLDAVRDRLDGVEETIAHREADRDEAGARSLEEARELARGLESMRERARELRESASGNPRGGRGLDPDAVRQYRSEAGSRLESARGLRERLRREGVDADPLDAVIRGLESLTGEGAYQDPEELARLQTALADHAQRLELTLRIRLAGEDGLRLFQSGDGAVPSEYRELVDAYYRSLSREQDDR